MSYLGKRDRKEDNGYGPPQKRPQAFGGPPGHGGQYSERVNDRDRERDHHHMYTGGPPPSRRTGAIDERFEPSYASPPNPPLAPFPSSRDREVRVSEQPLGIPDDKPGNVLLFTILNPKYPITVDVMHTICTNSGAVVNKIIILRKNGVQALVELDNPKTAEVIKESLNGADIYSGCCTLKIEWTKPTRLTVSKNDQDNWDYTSSGPESSKPLLPDPKFDGQSRGGYEDHRPGPPTLVSDGYLDYPRGGQPPTGEPIQPEYDAYGKRPMSQGGERYMGSVPGTPGGPPRGNGPPPVVDPYMDPYNRATPPQLARMGGEGSGTGLPYPPKPPQHGGMMRPPYHPSETPSRFPKEGVRGGHPMDVGLRGIHPTGIGREREVIPMSGERGGPPAKEEMGLHPMRGERGGPPMGLERGGPPVGLERGSVPGIGGERGGSSSLMADERGGPNLSRPMLINERGGPKLGSGDRHIYQPMERGGAYGTERERDGPPPLMGSDRGSMYPPHMAGERESNSGGGGYPPPLMGGNERERGGPYTGERGPPFPGERGPPFQGERGPPFQGERGPPFQGERGPPFQGERGPSFQGERGPPFQGERGERRLPLQAERGPSFQGERGPPFQGERGPPFQGERGERGPAFQGERGMLFQGERSERGGPPFPGERGGVYPPGDRGRGYPLHGGERPGPGGPYAPMHGDREGGPYPGERSIYAQSHQHMGGDRERGHYPSQMGGGGERGGPPYPPSMMMGGNGGVPIQHGPRGGPMDERGMGGGPSIDYDELMGPPDPMLQHGSVIMVYGLDEMKMNCQKMFNLFCLYGNVVRVKFLKSKEGVAMVQMGDSASCERAANGLNGSFLFGHKLLIGSSKQPFIQDVQSPHDLSDGSPSFQDFLGNRNNRFGTPEQSAKNRIHSSSKVLYFFNAPPNLTEDDLNKLFKDAKMKEPKKIKIFPSKTDKSCTGLLEWDQKSDSLEALVTTNHTHLPNPNGKNPYIIKFCFSDVNIKNNSFGGISSNSSSGGGNVQSQNPEMQHNKNPTKPNNINSNAVIVGGGSIGGSSSKQSLSSGGPVKGPSIGNKIGGSMGMGLKK